MDEKADDDPFCFWYGAGEPHRPFDWRASIKAGLPLEEIELPACLPDNETVRTDVGDYYLKVQRFDRDAARIARSVGIYRTVGRPLLP